jgi:hypothetical protein
MKKVFLVLALVATVLVSCKNVDAPAALTKVDSTAVVVDSVQVDSTEEGAIIEAEKVQDSIDAATTK